MNVKNMWLFIEVLRTTSLPQTHGTRVDVYGYCAVGLAERECGMLWRPGVYDSMADWLGIPCGLIGLKSLNRHDVAFIVEMNDRYRMTFREIAAVLEGWLPVPVAPAVRAIKTETVEELVTAEELA